MTELNLPKYERIATVLRKRIVLGIYAVGSQLPPEPELQQEFSVSRATIRSAIQRLVKQGLVDVHQGRGTTVLHKGNLRRFDNIISITEKNAVDLSKTVLRIDETPLPDPQFAAFFHIPLRTPVYRLQRIECNADRIPTSLLTNYLPKEIVPDFISYDGAFIDLYSFLLKTYGIRYKHAEETISAEAADLVVSQVLRVPVGAPLISLRRMASSTAGPMECSYMLCRPDFFQIIVTMED